MGDNKRKAPPSAAAAGAAQKRQSVPASPPGSPRAADGLEDLLEHIRTEITDRENAKTAGINRALAEAQKAAGSAETKLLSSVQSCMKVKEENKHLQQQLEEAVQASAKKALQQLPHFTQYSQSRTEAVPPGDAIFTYLEENFLRTATRHRGPRQGDPHRSAPEFQVRTFRVRVRRSHTPSSRFSVSSGQVLSFPTKPCAEAATLTARRRW